VAASTIKVDALADGPIKVDAKALLETIAAIVKGAGESLQFAENTYSITVTKADADLAMANTMAQLLAAGKTADEAQGIIDRAVGTTDAERIDYIRKAWKPRSAWAARHHERWHALDRTRNRHRRRSDQASGCAVNALLNKRGWAQKKPKFRQAITSPLG
jgi:hypothetical protein